MDEKRGEGELVLFQELEHRLQLVRLSRQRMAPPHEEQDS